MAYLFLNGRSPGWPLSKPPNKLVVAHRFAVPRGHTRGLGMLTITIVCEYQLILRIGR